MALRDRDFDEYEAYITKHGDDGLLDGTKYNEPLVVPGFTFWHTGGGCTALLFEKGELSAGLTNGESIAPSHFPCMLSIARGNWDDGFDSDAEYVVHSRRGIDQVMSQYDPDWQQIEVEAPTQAIGKEAPK